MLIARSLLALTAAILASSVFYYMLFTAFARNADNASGMLEGIELLGGNWLLKGWVLPPGNFVTSDLFLYGLFAAIFGPMPHVMYYVPAFLWAVTVVLSCILATEGLRGTTSATERTTALAAVLTLVAFPIFKSNPEMGGNLSQAPIHVGTIVYMMACFLVLSRLEGGDGRWPKIALAFYTGLSAISVFGDPMHAVLAGLPAINVSSFRLIAGSTNRRFDLAVIGLTTLSIIAGYAILGLFHRYGFFSPAVGTHLVTLDVLGRNLAYAGYTALMHVGSWTTGDAGFWELTVKVLRSGFLVLFCFALASVGFRIAAALATVLRTRQRGRLPGYLEMLLCTGAAVNIAAFVALYEPGSRYLMPGFVFGSVLIARLFCRSKPVRYYALSSLAVSVLYVLATSPMSFSPVLASKEHRDVARWLVQSGLKHGFGQFWDSNIMTVLTQGEVKVRPLTTGQDVMPSLWHADKLWFRPENFRTGDVFVLTRTDLPAGDVLDLDSINMRFGPPARTESVGPFRVSIYPMPNQGVERLLALPGRY